MLRLMALGMIALTGTVVPLTGQIAEDYRTTAQQIIAAAQADSFAYQRLAELVDTFGPRLSGSRNLENAIDWILAQMAADGLENVRGEPVMVPHWVRGAESLEVLSPRKQPLAMLGLGGSVSTPRRGITAPVLVVDSFDDLMAKAHLAEGRIVLYNVPFTTYGETVRYRWSGAVEAAKVGAVASLVRSVTPHSLHTPHTGGMGYEDDIRRIPHAAITVEDALLFQRWQDRGEEIVVRLKMAARTLPDARSRNVVAELRGREAPGEIVVLGGHIDSWDVGQGAMDDAGGCVAAWEALRLLTRLGLRPRRTIRVVLWTNEENGLRGGRAYRDANADHLEDHVLAMESDAGVFRPSGFGFSGSAAALDVVREIATLLEPIKADSISEGGGGADISPLMEAGVPGMGLAVEHSRYFWYHHSNADTIDKLDPEELNLCVAALAVMAYVVADMPQRLPR
ncbi:MAG: M28 family metallopeptidase [Candidatus Neomarinimicrobiota bacterium]